MNRVITPGDLYNYFDDLVCDGLLQYDEHLAGLAVFVIDAIDKSILSDDLSEILAEARAVLKSIADGELLPADGSQ